MFFSKEEERVMKGFFSDLAKSIRESFILEFKDGTVIEAKVDTCYETDNGLDDDDVDYQEYYACAMRIKKIISEKEDDYYKVGNLIEISNLNYPSKIKKLDGKEI